CVCYGLGRFSCCPIARHQLAFLLLLLEEFGVRKKGGTLWGGEWGRTHLMATSLSLQVPPRWCWVFDPVFSAKEVEVLLELGLQLLPDNEEGKHSIEGSATLFYMVHCGKALYNNLLWRNWTPEALSKIIIIGNSFKGIEERWVQPPWVKVRSTGILKGTEEAALPAHPRYLDTFNDTSIHWFPLQRLKELPPDVWNFLEEPTTYEDCEIIRKDQSPAAAES
ncbi:SRR1L protein, partial [Turnix velox]|nr:SRR1L protein [Turnix velox]